MEEMSMTAWLAIATIWLVTAIGVTIFLVGGFVLFKKENNGEKLVTFLTSRMFISSAIYIFIIALGAIGLYLDLQMRLGWISWTLLALLLIPWHIILSWDTVPLGKIGVLIFFGRIVKEVEEGPVWKPYPFFKLIPHSRRMQELELPAPSKDIWRGNVDQIPAGRVPAFRVTHLPGEDESMVEELSKKFDSKMTMESLEKLRNSTSKTSETHDEESEKLKKQVKNLPVSEKSSVLDSLFCERITSEVELYFRWRTCRAGEFEKNYGNVEEVNKQLEDTGTGVALGNLARLSFGTATILLDSLNWQLREEVNLSLIKMSNSFETREEVDEILEEDDPKVRYAKLQDLLGSLGIYIEEARIKRLNLNHDLNTSIANAAQARYEKIKTVTDAEAKRREIAEVGAGEAEAAMSMAKVMETEGGKTARSLEVVEQGLKQSRHTIIPGGEGIAGLVGAATTIQEVLNQQKAAASEPTSKPSKKPKKVTEDGEGKAPDEENMI